MEYAGVRALVCVGASQDEASPADLQGLNLSHSRPLVRIYRARDAELRLCGWQGAGRIRAYETPAATRNLDQSSSKDQDMARMRQQMHDKDIKIDALQVSSYRFIPPFSSIEHLQKVPECSIREQNAK